MWWRGGERMGQRSPGAPETPHTFRSLTGMNKRQVPSATGVTLDPPVLAYHELRAPLGLLATAARAALETATDDATRESLETVVRVADRTLRIAAQVLALNRPREQGAKGLYQPSEVLEELVTSLRAAGVHAWLLCEGESDRTVIRGVRDQFEALASSLAGNALDHREPGTAIELRTFVDAFAFTVAILNVRARTRYHEGLGLGSTLADAFASRMDGEITREIEGDTYIVRLRLPR